MPEPNMSRCWDVANFCPLVVFVAGVRVVEFGSYFAFIAARMQSIARHQRYSVSVLQFTSNYAIFVDFVNTNAIFFSGMRNFHNVSR